MTHELDAASFGVVADGVTDDTVAMQSALDFCASCACGSEHVVKIPKGMARITRALFGYKTTLTAA